jgi:hypothetical protein
MASYIVMADPNDRTGESVRFVRDSFSVFAFLLPLVWLLWKHLWLEAALLFAALGLVTFGAHFAFGESSLSLMPMVSAALGLLCALEGPARQIADLERRGMTAAQIIPASSLRDAEEIFASRLEAAVRSSTAPSRAFQPVSRSSLIPLTGAV